MCSDKMLELRNVYTLYLKIIEPAITHFWIVNSNLYDSPYVTHASSKEHIVIQYSPDYIKYNPVTITLPRSLFSHWVLDQVFLLPHSLRTRLPQVEPAILWG